MADIGVIAVTAAGRAAAGRLVAAWPDEAEVVRAEPPAEALRRAFTGSGAVVGFLAVGATVRVLAPLLGDKSTDPPVVCVDESLRFAVAVLGGHHGANELAHRVAAVLGCEPVVTTASDSVAGTPLDSYGADLGFTVADPGPLARVGAALLSGEPVRLEGAGDWPLPALPDSADAATPAADAAAVIAVTDRTDGPGTPDGPGHPLTLVYRPPSLVVGVGSARGAPAEEVGGLVDAALADAGLAPASVRAVATVDLKADEAGILAAARDRGWDVVTRPAAELAAVDVPNPSEVVRAEVGTPSVAEAAALRTAADAGRAAELVVAKRKSANATVAIARLRPRGRLAVVGLGPGARDLTAPRAVAELGRASVVVGLDQYVDQVRDLLRPGTRVLDSGLGQEEERARSAVCAARTGAAVALIGSGDAGVYAMASPALDFAGADIDVVGVPGITAAAAAANLLGAPLGHDHAYVSLSDLHTPWEAIERRVRAAAEGDFAVCFYNPRSRRRDWQLARALEILAEHRPPETPVGHVRNASRDGERVRLTTLEDMLAGGVDEVDMFTVVLVGGSASRAVAGRFVTPRGYRWKG
ncbi:cobalt-precorrin 5A hydrolase/precorrin-3B C17-methyltransferase [Spinactinospora alkalitolerans]|uniref:Cobalt-precorrin 5A hydrolase/precorrin-3B C17-methyltransferase n=1 Tax=Spinactinospora alkalitolerans TaxID=687207 RepID=A0A852TRT7_9ACTN|nr:precorrin-3B C(17)-methyltransferase [Spinactinospora alkalitolerans]NYE46281.1 cobalt-precorrin 5A hydrolase/precorrin-3B C17-methyltransferase [Spinactinospora alkalitolerans]